VRDQASNRFRAPARLLDAERACPLSRSPTGPRPYNAKFELARHDPLSLQIALAYNDAVSDHLTRPNVGFGSPPGKVSVVGLGMMGAAIAEALLGHGHDVTVWNRSADKASDLVGRGATVAHDVETAFAASPVTLICVTDHPATMDILAGDRVGFAAKDRAIVQLSTMTSAES
jgi:NADPH-dependent 2,4-dienoyl-CoA reductase/sulfur reductase-like enzyme